MEKKESFITIGGRKIECEIDQINIFKLQYYPENPRVNSILSQYPQEDITQDFIEKQLWKLDSTKDLFLDIRRNQGLIEEIIVKDREVIEGNSRLCAYRKLYERAQTDDERKLWQYIRAKILPSDITPEEVFTILGVFHIKGKADWRTYEKAAYLFKMVKVFGKKEKNISEMIGISVSDIKNMIASYETMNRGNVTDLNKFSFFIEYNKNRELAKIRDEDPTFTDKFINLVKEEKIPRAEKVRDLSTILKDKKARKYFFDEDEDFEYSLEIAQKRHPERVDTFYKTLKKTTEIIRNAPVQKIKEDIENNTNKKDIVRRLVREVKKFYRNIELDLD